MKKFMIFICCCFAMNVQAAQITTLSWEDLIPESEKIMLDIWEKQAEKTPFDQTLLEEKVFPDNPKSPMPSGFGKVRSDLNGKYIKIPGFVIPLEGDEQKITELLLVPYFGACLHVPPPPANQIIHVKFKQGVEIKELWDVVYIVGKLQAQTLNHELAEVGYSIEGVKVEAYTEDD